MTPEQVKSAEHLFRVTFLNNPYLRHLIPKDKATVDLTEIVSGPQFVFLTHPAKEILYGGAAGGGKSRALLYAALQYVIVPKYSALLCRRKFTDLEKADALIPQSHDVLAGTDARYDGQKRRWHFPNGATLEFGYMDAEADKYNYKGAAYQFCGFDESTEFTPTQYTYLRSRVRRPMGSLIPIRIRAATNPGGQSHQFFKERFIKEKTRHKDCVFIPANAKDNRWLDVEQYRETLNELTDTVERARLRDGNWDIQPIGMAFNSEWFRYWTHNEATAYLLGERRVLKSDCTRFASADIAGTEAQDNNDPDFSVIQIWDQSPFGDLILVHQERGQMEIPDVEQKLMETMWDWECQFAVVEKNGIGLPVVQTAKRRGLAISPVVAKRDKFARSQASQILMEQGQIWFPKHAPWLEDFESELLAFPQDGLHDDQVDAMTVASQRAIKMNDPRKREKQIAHDGKIAADADAQESAEAEEARRRFVDEVMGDDRRIWHEVT